MWNPCLAPSSSTSHPSAQSDPGLQDFMLSPRPNSAASDPRMPTRLENSPQLIIVDESSQESIPSTPSRHPESVSVVGHPASPFSQLFPDEFLATNGVDLAVGLEPFGGTLEQIGEAKRSENDAGGTPVLAEYACSVCSFSADDRDAFMKHKRKHAGEKTHGCALCGSAFTRRSGLDKHIRRKHVTSAASLPKYCPFAGCSYVTRNANSFTMHKKSHSAATAKCYFCKACPSVKYSSRRSILMHLTLNHGSDSSLFGMAPVDADCVGKKAGKKGKTPRTEGTSVKSPRSRPITEVMPVITPQKEIPSRKVPTPPSGKKRGSGGVVPLLDESLTNCAKTKTQKNSFATPKTTFECDRCPYSTRTFQALYAHRKRTHNATQRDGGVGQNLHSCMFCRKKFLGSDRLLNHIKRVHISSKKGTKRSQFACKTCDFATSTKRVYTAHKKMHQAEESQKKHRNTVHEGPAAKRGKRRNSLPGNPAVETASNTTSQSPAALNSLIIAASQSASSLPRPQPINGVSRHPVPNQYIDRSINQCNVSAAIPLEIEDCMKHLQSANASLMQLCRRKDTELNQLKSAVMKLISFLVPNQAMLGLISGAQIGEGTSYGGAVDSLIADILQRCGSST